MGRYDGIPHAPSIQATSWKRAGKNCTIYQPLHAGGKRSICVTIVSYILAVDGKHRSISELTQIIHDKLSPEVKVEIMSLAERLIEEGRLKGELEGKLDEKIEISLRMLEEGVDPVFVAKITRLPIERIKSLYHVLRDKVPTQNE